MKIVLMRHAKPDLTPPFPLKLMSAIDFNLFSSEYDNGGITYKRDHILDFDLEHYFVCCSDLKRSQDTAYLFDRKPNVIDPLFSEVRFSKIESLFPAPYALFSLLCQFRWFFNLNSDYEDRKKTVLRAKIASDFLEKLAGEHKNLLVITHGIFLKVLAKELIKRKWLTFKKNKYNYLEYSIFNKL
ncbi:histidine phosphatase family protein [Leptospira sp. 201903071]|uniref:histidine phosphatase family protein n=1 Tax=Leptospira ainazelensis TaxID=2810034 RepID=UPI001964EF37|nr:histidine phosphatase family protein [Leptospira ainazelensis]MBM9502387.1 histidine phosphatase family protein [Leptospira ainazelensis]